MTGVSVLSGMRERKRQQRNDHIISCAIELFQDNGYVRTTMEDIAARADVSPPTVYRYFPTKSALLTALFWKDRRDRAARLEEFHGAAESMGAVTALSGLLYLNNRAGSSKKDRKLWREALAELVRGHDSANDEFRIIKQEFERHIERMLRNLHRASKLVEDAPLEALRSVLYAVASENFQRLIANEFRTAAEERRAMDEQVALTLAGWLPSRK